jgi:Ca2+-binding EF-hand superfamily protein
VPHRFTAVYALRSTYVARAHQALFRAGDSDDDGLVTYDEFVALVKLIDPEIADPKVIKIYRHALETASEEMVRCLQMIIINRAHI